VCVRARVLCVNVEIDVLVLYTHPPEQATVCARAPAHACVGACMTKVLQAEKAEGLRIHNGTHLATYSEAHSSIGYASQPIPLGRSLFTIRALSGRTQSGHSSQLTRPAAAHEAMSCHVMSCHAGAFVTVNPQPQPTAPQYDLRCVACGSTVTSYTFTAAVRSGTHRGHAMRRPAEPAYLEHRLHGHRHPALMLLDCNLWSVTHSAH
jgi:hypothetical protein